LFEYVFVQIRFCSNTFLFKYVFVQIRFCSNTFLFKYVFVRFRMCTLIPTFSIPRTSKILPIGDFWYENIPSGNPGSKTEASRLVIVYVHKVEFINVNNTVYLHSLSCFKMFYTNNEKLFLRRFSLFA
jgi:hypothetical protein